MVKLILLIHTLDGKANTSHTHTIANVTDLQTSLDGKANTSHTHNISDVTDLQTSLDGKANTSHTHNISDVTNLQTTLDNKSNSNHTHDIYFTKAQLVELFYPVGSIYISTSRVNPSIIFGIGTWSQIIDRFLYCANSSGTYGGSNNVILSIDNLPSHDHVFSGYTSSGEIKSLMRYDGADETGYSATGVFSGTTRSGTRSWQGIDKSNGKIDVKFSMTPMGKISYIGNGQAFSIMPQYMTVYCWKRTG